MNMQPAQKSDHPNVLVYATRPRWRRSSLLYFFFWGSLACLCAWMSVATFFAYGQLSYSRKNFDVVFDPKEPELIEKHRYAQISHLFLGSLYAMGVVIPIILCIRRFHREQAKHVPPLNAE